MSTSAKLTPEFLILAGVRYFIRGVDDNGHVANYVETEQMMVYNGYRASFVQVITVTVHSCMVVNYDSVLVHNVCVVFFVISLCLLAP